MINDIKKVGLTYHEFPLAEYAEYYERHVEYYGRHAAVNDYPFKEGSIFWIQEDYGLCPYLSNKVHYYADEFDLPKNRSLRWYPAHTMKKRISRLAIQITEIIRKNSSLGTADDRDWETNSSA